MTLLLTLFIPLSAAKAGAWVTAVVADNQHAEHIVSDNTKQDRVWKAVYKATANSVLDNRVLRRICTNTLDGGVDLDAKFVTESGTLLVVVCDRVIEIGCGEWVILNPHSVEPPVRRKNSA